jgi:hypothetical protein
MPTCGARHPEEDRRCIKAESGHADHYDGTVGWADPEIAERLRLSQQQGTNRKGGKAATRRHLIGLAAGGARGVREFRTINTVSQQQGMQEAATSEESGDFRRLFLRTMIEIAVAHPEVTTNDVWDLLESRGYDRGRGTSAQAAGTVGGIGIGMGLWERTDRMTENTSGNGHSTDNAVRVYRSLILGRDPLKFVGPVDQRLAELAMKRRG